MINPDRFYSRGYHATVHKITADEQAKFPGAELVRIEIDASGHLAETKALQLQIANLLRPGHFIEVAGFQTTEIDPQYSNDHYPEGELMHRLYSRKAPVPEEHAFFSTHYLTTKIDSTKKCDCSRCRIHTQYHSDNRLTFEAIRLQYDLAQWGLQFLRFGDDDPSDYCLTMSNKLIVFEIENFDQPQFYKSLKEHQENDAQVDRLEDLWERYRAIGRNRGLTGKIADFMKKARFIS